MTEKKPGERGPAKRTATDGKEQRTRKPTASHGEAVLRVTDGRVFSLGAGAEFAQGALEITGYTGGNSWGGALSTLWFFLDGNAGPLPPEDVERLSREAAEFQLTYGDGLSQGANALLHRLASVVPAEQKPLRPGHDSQASAASAGNKVIVAIGDLHGHYPALEQLLGDLRSRFDLFEHNDPDKLRRGVTLVFTGDYIDRGDEALAIIEKLRKIGAANPRHLVTLLGNHELLALEAYDTAVELSRSDHGEDAIEKYRNSTSHGGNGGDHFIREFGQYTTPALKSYVARMARNGDIGGWMRALLPFFETNIADRKVLFIHADLSERLRDREVFDRYLRTLERRLDIGSAEAGGTKNKYGAEMFSSGSIFWSRSFSKLDGADQASIDNICDGAKVDFLVTGHTPHKTLRAYGNRIFDIDVGMTPRCGGNTPRALMFRSDGIVGFGVDGSETLFQRW